MTAETPHHHISKEQLAFLTKTWITHLSKKYPNEGLRWDEKNEAYLLESLLLISKMASPRAFIFILNHMFTELGRSLRNGHNMGMEHHELKAKKVEGVIDHHGERERTWGLMNAFFMSVFLGMLHGFDNLHPLPEEKLDKDQGMAFEAMAISQSPTFSPEQLLQFLDKGVEELLAEEFGLFCQGHQPLPKEEIIARIRKENPEHSDFEMPFTKVHILKPQSADMSYIAIIECQLDKLPVMHGYWNHLVAHLVAEALTAHGISDELEKGVVTWVMHGEKRITDEMRTFRVPHSTEPLYPEGFEVKTVRRIFGIFGKNKAAWHDQFLQNRHAIETHGLLAEMLHQTYRVHPERNVLAAATSVLKGIFPEQKNISSQQLAHLDFVKKVEALGYKMLDKQIKKQEISTPMPSFSGITIYPDDHPTQETHPDDWNIGASTA